MHTFGARLGHIRRNVVLEYTLIALLTSEFTIATAVLRLGIGLEFDVAWVFGAMTALALSAISIIASAFAFLIALRFQPATVLLASG